MKFHIVSRGDRTTGSGDHYATVDIDDVEETPEYILMAREELGKSFKVLFDDPKPQVFTEEEFAALMMDPS